MKERRLIICDDDREFIGRLGGYFSRKKEVSFQIACFSDRDQMRLYLEENDAEGILIGEDWLDVGPGGKMIRRLILTETDEKRDLPEGCLSVYKYQAAEDILRQVMLGLEIPGGGQKTLQGETELYGVYTPGGWTEGTRLALAMTRILGKRGPSIYVGLNEFSPASRMLGKPEAKDLSDVIYCRRRGRLEEEQLERMVIHLQGYDCIPAPVNPAELAELNEQDIRGLMEDICRIGGYQYVVVDFGGSIAGRLSLFGAAKQNFAIYPATETGVLQQSVFETFWRSIGAEGILKRCCCAGFFPEEYRLNRKEKAEDGLDELAEGLLRTADEQRGC